MNVFLVHGSFGKPFENWFPWLEAELSRSEISCIIPSFPTPDHQEYSDWETLMDYYCKIGVVNSETVLIGHSCGTVFLAHYLMTHNLCVKGLICVSGYNNFISGYDVMDKLNESFYFDYSSLDLSNKVGKIVSFYGDDDPHIPQSYLYEFAKTIGGEIHCVANAGHFNSAAGYDKCEVVLNAIKAIMKASEKSIPSNSSCSSDEQHIV